MVEISSKPAFNVSLLKWNYPRNLELSKMLSLGSDNDSKLMKMSVYIKEQVSQMTTDIWQ